MKLRGPRAIVKSARTENPTLVGSANEVEVKVEGLITTALLDTGSTVSSVSESFYDGYLTHLDIQPLEQLLHVECADGQPLPYLGYVEVNIVFSGLCGEQCCLLLVVPRSNYNSQVPLLLGTNVLSVLMEDCRSNKGAKFLQTMELETPWYLSFRCMVFRERDLAKNKNVIGLVKRAANMDCILKPNSTITVKGYIDQKVAHPTTCALIQPTIRTSLSTDIEVTPSVFSYLADCSQPLDIQLSNVTNQTCVIPPKAILCAVLSVTVEKLPEVEENVSSNCMDKIHFSNCAVTEDELQRGTCLIQGYDDIFSHGDDDIGCTDIVRHRVDLSDPTPFKQRHRRIPPSMYDEVKTHLQQLMSAGVIQPSSSP